MSVSSINNNLPSYINLPNRAERINAIDNRIVANNREIVSLESQIAAHKEVSSITREMIVNNAESINTIKELIGNNEKSIKFLQETQVLAKESKDVAEARLNNLKETQVLAKESRDLAESRLNNLKETLVLTEQVIDLNQQAIDCIEKMLSIMMKNPAKYGGLDKSQFQQLPQVVEAKKNLIEVIAVKLNQYPKEEHAGLMDTALRVIDRTFYEINTADLSSNKKIFQNLEKNIDTALAEQYSLMKDDCMSTIRNYRIIQSLFHNFSSLSIRNFKI